MDKILTGTVVVPESKRSQLIYSSQAYNTHFNIFAEFIGDYDIITKMNFEFVNYTGPINLGIVDIGDIEVTSTNKTNFYILPVTIQGLPEKNKVKTCKEFKNGEFKLNSTKANYLIIIRNLKMLKDDRESNSSAYQTELDPDSTFNEVFDSEFFNRDGIRSGSYNSKNRLPNANVKEIKQEIDKISNEPQFADIDIETKIFKILGGYRCMFSASKIVSP